MGRQRPACPDLELPPLETVPYDSVGVSPTSAHTKPRSFDDQNIKVYLKGIYPSTRNYRTCRKRKTENSERETHRILSLNLSSASSQTCVIPCFQASSALIFGTTNSPSCPPLSSSPHPPPHTRALRKNCYLSTSHFPPAVGFMPDFAGFVSCPFHRTPAQAETWSVSQPGVPPPRLGSGKLGARTTQALENLACNGLP